MLKSQERLYTLLRISLEPKPNPYSFQVISDHNSIYNLRAIQKITEIESFPACIASQEALHADSGSLKRFEKFIDIWLAKKFVLVSARGGTQRLVFQNYND